MCIRDSPGGTRLSCGGYTDLKSASKSRPSGLSPPESTRRASNQQYSLLAPIRLGSTSHETNTTVSNVNLHTTPGYEKLISRVDIQRVILGFTLDMYLAFTFQNGCKFFDETWLTFSPDANIVGYKLY